MRKIIDWLEHRTGIHTAVKSFLYEEIPASSGWHQVIGSMALFFFMIQGVTGILLAFNYAPTPGEAYNSLHYIMTEVVGGRFIRGLHHWGASMMIVVVVLHMIQVFLFGAYKKPREATWMMGVVLLLVTLAFGLTGYLLPWDNRAYWGTVVTTQIAGGAPVFGQYLQRLLGGEGVGVVTFARFFAAHVVLLPPIMLVLIGIHVFLVRKHGVAPVAEETAPPKKFYPEQVFKDTIAFAIAFVALVLAAQFVDVPLERLADPTDTTYIPRPEWYFLFLFQMLKVFKGPFEIIGSTVLPGIAVLVLFCVPFIDRAPMIRLSKRVFAFSIATLALLGWGALTTVAYVTTPKNPEGGRPPDFNASQLTEWQKLTPAELAGLGYFRSENCIACHPGAGKKGTGPDLTQMPDNHRSAAWLVMHFKEPAEMVPGSAMPPVRLRDSELNSLSLFVMKLTQQNEEDLLSAPAKAVLGAQIYTDNHCTACHSLQGSGMKVGPALDGVGDRHDRKWLEEHFKNPSALSKGSKMPAYKFDATQMEAICDYLLQMP
jgi:ubiquinol-cytochrome c reductase cytochrome b subunit